MVCCFVSICRRGALVYRLFIARDGVFTGSHWQPSARHAFSNFRASYSCSSRFNITLQSQLVCWLSANIFDNFIIFMIDFDLTNYL